MSFADKYEVVESVTRGRVETFTARRIATGETVLAHIFECPEQKPNQPTIQWVLESFQAIAPAPAEVVIDSGQYAGTSYAYLVTKLPGGEQLRRWVSSYEQGQRECGEPAAEAVFTADIEKADELPAREQDQVGTSSGPHGITAAFESLRLGLAPESSQLSAVGNPASGPAVDLNSFPESGGPFESTTEKREPGEFTKNFFAEFNGSQHDTAINVAAESRGRDDSVLGAGNTGIADSGFAELAAPPGQSSGSESPVASTVNPRDGTVPAATPAFSATSALRTPVDRLSMGEEAPTGEFTSFFRGPFNGERAERVPDLSESTPPPAKKVGEFTEVFGSAKDVPSAGTPSSLPTTTAPSAPSSDPGSLTAFWSRVDDAPKEARSDPLARPILKGPSSDVSVRRFSTETRPKEPASEGSGASDLFTPGASPGIATSPGVRDPGPRFAAGSESAGATRLFTTDRASGTSPLPLPDGPSEYTRFISSGLRNVNPAAGAASAAQPPGAAPTPAMPPMPPAPPIAVPSPYAPPQVPQFPQPGVYPQIPQPAPMAVPRMPQVPQPGGEPPKAAVPWALILTLNGLFVLAVLLVLYFMLKR